MPPADVRNENAGSDIHKVRFNPLIPFRNRLESKPSLLRQAALCLLLSSALPYLASADLLPEAARSFPEGTVSLERDNLKVLRKLPAYGTLRQMYSSKSLTQAKAGFEQLGIPESALDEVSIGSSPAGYFGLASGAWDPQKTRTGAEAKGVRSFVADGVPVFCPSNATCVAFLVTSLAAWGTEAQVRSIVDTRLGRSKALAANPQFMSLLESIDRNAPVVGVAPGSELNNWIGDALPRELLSEDSLRSALSSIDLFSYSVQFDRQAHVKLALQCHSVLEANTLSGTLKTLSAMQAIGSRLGNTALPFSNLTATAAGRVVSMQLEAPIPSQ